MLAHVIILRFGQDDGDIHVHISHWPHVLFPKSMPRIEIANSAQDSEDVGGTQNTTHKRRPTTRKFLFSFSSSGFFGYHSRPVIVCARGKTFFQWPWLIFDLALVN